jgi:Carboxypeptidase regulatory-like domain
MACANLLTRNKATELQSETKGMKLLASRFYVLLAVQLGILAMAASVRAQTVDNPEPEPGIVVGTVTAVNGDTLPEANVVLEGTDDRRSATANDDGYFEFHNVKPGLPYQVRISADGFSEWSSPLLTLEPGQFKILTDIRLQVQATTTTVNVTQTSEEIATEQVKLAEKQRILGIIPNFYVVYDPDPEPLTAKLKFQLALRTASDPITALGVAFLAGAQQAGDTPNYSQGAEGYGKRYGANAADGFSDIMVGGAILPAILHQDPRYFYQGTGTKKSRFNHAFFHPFVCQGDNGKPQPNYSTLGGDLASSAISNLYYPQSNRGAGLVFTNFGINTAERVAISLAQEFVIHPMRAHGSR